MTPHRTTTGASNPVTPSTKPGSSPTGGASAAGGLPLRPVARALAGRPDLWPVAAKAGVSLAARGWWRRPPFLPLPDPDWLRFRMTTAYGGDGGFGEESPFDPTDLITWLEWRKEWPA